MWVYISGKVQVLVLTLNCVYSTLCTPREQPSLSRSLSHRYHDTVIPAIRAIDPETIILAGTPTWTRPHDFTY